MTSLLKAVYQRLTTSPGVLALATGGVHWGMAPADAAMPYLVLKAAPSIAPQVNTGSDGIEQRTVRFQAYAVSMAVAGRLIEILEAEFVDNGNLPVLDSGRVMEAEKSADDLQLDPDRDEDGSEVWQGLLDIEFTVQREPGH